MKDFLLRLDKALDFFLKNFLILLKVTAVFFIILEILDYYFYTESDFSGLPYLYLNNLPASFRGNLLNVELFALIALVFVVLTVGLVLLYQLAFFKTTEFLHQGKKINVILSYQLAWNDLKGYAVVTGLVLFKSFLWSLLFIIPGIIVSLLYSFAFLACAFDGKKGNAALAYSKELVRNNLKKFLGNMAGGLIIVVGFYACLFSIIEWVFRVHESCLFTVKAASGEILQDLSLALCAGYIFVFVYFFYNDMKKNNKELK